MVMGNRGKLSMIFYKAVFDNPEGNFSKRQHIPGGDFFTNRIQNEKIIQTRAEKRMVLKVKDTGESLQPGENIEVSCSAFCFLNNQYQLL